MSRKPKSRFKLKHKPRTKGIRIDRLSELKIDLLDEKFNYIGSFSIKELVRKGLI